MNTCRLITLSMVAAGLHAAAVWGAEDPAIPRAKVAQFLEIEAMRQENPLISLADWELVSGNHPKQYRLSEINRYLKNSKAEDTVAKQVTLQSKKFYYGPKTFPWLALRRSASDVLATEDPTLAIPGDRTFDDLEGALVSFHRDFLNDVNTWSAEAALIAPFAWTTRQTVRRGDFPKLVRYGIIPSYSLNRISTTGAPAEEVDLRTYRVGLFAKWKSGLDFPSALTARGFAAYTQDSTHDANIVAGEFEIEPQADFSPRSNKLKLGYAAMLIKRPDNKLKDDDDETAILAYQFRAFLRGEYGSVSNEGLAFVGSEFDYFRLGPVFQLDFKPFFLRRLQLSFRYQWLPTVSGDDHRANLTGIDTKESLFRADLEWLIVDPEVTPNSRVSLKASYVNGGLGPMQAKTETLLLGLGAAF